jgi:hypothetical protein
MDHGHQVSSPHTPDLDQPEGRVRQVTIVFAPPKQGNTADRLADGVEFSGADPELMWAAMMREAFERLLEPGDGARSQLDDIVSEAVGEPVTVWHVASVDDAPLGRFNFPGLIIAAESILDLRGRPLERDFGDRTFCERVSKALKEHTGAGLIGCQVARERAETDRLGGEQAH